MRLRHRTIATAGRTVLGLVSDMRAGDIGLDPPYQRGDVWSTEQRVALIRSVLLGVPVAAIVLNNRWDNDAWATANGPLPEGEPAWSCIDGKQRLTTCAMWLNDELTVPADWFDMGHGLVAYSHLDATDRRQWKNVLTLPVAEARLGSVEEEAEVYGLINSAGTAHTAADLRRAADGAHATTDRKGNV